MALVALVEWSDQSLGGSALLMNDEESCVIQRVTEGTPNKCGVDSWRNPNPDQAVLV